MLRWLTGLSRPSLRVVLAPGSSYVLLAASSITGHVLTLKLAHLGPAPRLLRTLIFIQQDWGESVHGKPGFKRAQIHTEHFMI